MSVSILSDHLPDRIHMIEIPMPNNPLRALCSYIIQGLPGERSLMIDTGFNEPEAFASVLMDLETLGIDLDRLDLLTTHLHSDHSGQLLTLKRSATQVFAGAIDADLINQMATDPYWEQFSSLFHLLGLKEDQITYKEHPGYTYCPKSPIDFTKLLEGDQLHYGGYTLEVIHVFGHTPGHIALVERQNGLLFCGDHILPRITPNIAFWGYEHGDILGTFFESLEKVRQLSLTIGCAAHRGLLMDINNRIDELKSHHQERLDDILSILEKHPDQWFTARQIAAQMHWDLTIKEFEAFPKPQKWFASAEAMSHLIHLNVIGKIEAKPMSSSSDALAEFKALLK